MKKLAVILGLFVLAGAVGAVSAVGVMEKNKWNKLHPRTLFDFHLAMGNGLITRANLQAFLDDPYANIEAGQDYLQLYLPPHVGPEDIVMLTENHNITVCQSLNYPDMYNKPSGVTARGSGHWEYLKPADNPEKLLRQAKSLVDVPETAYYFKVEMRKGKIGDVKSSLKGGERLATLYETIVFLARAQRVWEERQNSLMQFSKGWIFGSEFKGKPISAGQNQVVFDELIGNPSDSPNGDYVTFIIRDVEPVEQPTPDQMEELVELVEKKEIPEEILCKWLEQLAKSDLAALVLPFYYPVKWLETEEGKCCKMAMASGMSYGGFLSKILEEKIQNGEITAVNLRAFYVSQVSFSGYGDLHKSPKDRPCTEEDLSPPTSEQMNRFYKGVASGKFTPGQVYSFVKNPIKWDPCIREDRFMTADIPEELVLPLSRKSISWKKVLDKLEAAAKRHNVTVVGLKELRKLHPIPTVEVASADANVLIERCEQAQFNLPKKGVGRPLTPQELLRELADKFRIVNEWRDNGSTRLPFLMSGGGCFSFHPAKNCDNDNILVAYWWEDMLVLEVRWVGFGHNSNFTFPTITQLAIMAVK